MDDETPDISKKKVGRQRKNLVMDSLDSIAQNNDLELDEIDFSKPPPPPTPKSIGTPKKEVKTSEIEPHIEKNFLPDLPSDYNHKMPRSLQFGFLNFIPVLGTFFKKMTGYKRPIQVYLVPPNSLPIHTKFIQHSMRTPDKKIVNLYYLMWNKTNYTETEVNEIMGDLRFNSCNFAFIDKKAKEGRDIFYKGSADFSKEAWEQITEIDTGKVEDREAEQTHFEGRQRYRAVEMGNFLLGMIIFGIIAFFLVGAFLGPLPTYVDSVNRIEARNFTAEAIKTILSENNGSITIGGNTIVAPTPNSTTRVTGT